MTAPDLPALKALLARVEALLDSKGIRQLELDLADAFGGQGTPQAPYLLRSTDAALAFFEAVLPGWGWTKYSDGSVAVGFYGKWFDQGDPLTNLALTIIAATLKAKIAEGEKNA